MATSQRKPVRRAAHTATPNVTVRTKGRVARERKQAAKPNTRPAGRVLIPIADAAKRLGLSVWTLRSWVYTGKVAYHRVGGAGRVMIADTEIERLIAASEIAATAA